MGVGCHLLLQGIFLTQGSNLCLLYLLHWQVNSLPLYHPGNPTFIEQVYTKDLLSASPELITSDPKGKRHSSALEFGKVNTH